MNFQPVREKGAIPGEDGNGGAEAARIAAHFAAEDAERRKWLNRRAYRKQKPAPAKPPAPRCSTCGGAVRPLADGSYRQRCRACLKTSGEWVQKSRARRSTKG
jgi:hypothetical protein